MDGAYRGAGGASVEDDDMTEGRRAEMERCIDACERCRATCLRTVAYCLDRGGRHAEKSHIAALLDCLEACTTCANFLLRDSPAQNRMCEVCAELGDVCADSCDDFRDDERMRECAAACRLCADACREMVLSGLRSR
jgi:hypothetical protein